MQQDHLSKILAMNPDRPELKLIYEMSGEIINISKKSHSKLQRTFVLSPWQSSCFGLEIINNKAYLGTPGHIFDLLAECYFYLVNYIPGKPGLYLILYSGKDLRGGIPIAIRIFMREKRVEALSMFKDLHIIRMSKNGTANPGFNDSEIKVKVKPSDGLDWENFDKMI